MGPDHGRISEIAGYVNHHIIISTAVSFPVMLSIIDANNRRILASLGLRQLKVWHFRVFQRSSTATLLRMQHRR